MWKEIFILALVYLKRLHCLNFMRKFRKVPSIDLSQHLKKSILGHILTQKQQKKISAKKVIHVDFKSL